MAEREKLIEVKDLQISFGKGRKKFVAVDHVNFDIYKGETFSLVGESGSGKTTIGRAITRINPTSAGEIYFKGKKINGKISKELDREVIKSCQMIFQDPMTSLNPVSTVGDQILEVLNLHFPDMTKEEKDRRVDEMMQMVGIPAARKHEYPHQFSGGMKQRIVIAMALVAEPELLLADEPTTALDVTIQAQILELMKQLKEKFNSAMILITHDLGVVAEFCDNVAIVYAGEVIEYGSVEEIYARRKNHPYTAGLFNCIPDLYTTTPRLDPIPGFMADPTDLPEGCKFAPRCPHCMDCCASEAPEMYYMGGHGIKCHLFREEGTHNADTTD